ncbi:unnamed protein product, partial [Allacma fusca]
PQSAPIIRFPSAVIKNVLTHSREAFV